MGVSSLLVSAGTGTEGVLPSRGKVLMCYFQPGWKAEVQPLSSHWSLGCVSFPTATLPV